MRASKYRHVFGQPAKKELCYENLRITKNAWDSNIIQTNGKYISVNWESSGGGAFAVIPVNETGKAPDTVSLFRGHKGPVLDTAFNPFNEQQIASCSDDGDILIWQIPDDYSFHKYLDEEENIKDVTEPIKVLSGHKKKVGLIAFHPCAENVLASTSLDYSVKIWNVGTGKDEITLQHNDFVTSISFNYNGSLLATCSRDKKLRIWDIRSGKIISEGSGHAGAKPSRVAWLGNTDRIVTTGFSKFSDRQIGIWDVENIDKGPINGFWQVDTSSGVLIPYFDVETSILYVAGKGDGNIRYYEYINDELFELSEYTSTDPQRGFAVAPKYSVNLKDNEVTKSYKTVLDNSIEPVSFIVPRRAEVFQADIYPDCPSTEPALSAEEWFSGKEVNGPLLITMESLYNGIKLEIHESKPVTVVNEVKKEAEQKKQEEIKLKSEQKEKKSDSQSTSAATASTTKKQETESTKEGTPGKNVDDLLKTSGQVSSLLNKVAEQSDDEDDTNQENGKDEAWEEVKKPVTKSLSPSKVDKKEEPKKKEPKKEEPKKEEPKKEEPKKVTSPVTNGKSVKRENQQDSKSNVPKKSTTNNDYTTVEKLAEVVTKLESRVSELTNAGLEKDKKLEALEKKLEELLKRSTA